MQRLVTLLVIGALLGGQAAVLPCGDGSATETAADPDHGTPMAPGHHAAEMTADAHPGSHGDAPSGSHHGSDQPLGCGALMACGVAALAAVGPTEVVPASQAHLPVHELPGSPDAEPRDRESPPPRSA